MTCDGSPLGSAVADLSGSIMVPLPHIHELADIHVDIFVFSRRGVLGQAFAYCVASCNGKQAAADGDGKLKVQGRPQVYCDRACHGADGQHEQIEAAGEQLDDDQTSGEQPPDCR